MQATIVIGKYFLDYCATHPDDIIIYHASDTILNVHSDASHIYDIKDCSRACIHYFLGWKPRSNFIICTKGEISTLCNVLKCVAVSAKESEKVIYVSVADRRKEQE